jgi:hypothetical protein
MEGMFLGRRGDDGVDLARERELDCRFDAVAGKAARPDGARPILWPLPGSLSPASDRNPPSGGKVADLILRPDQRHFGVERRFQGAAGDLRTDAAWIAERNGDSDQLRSST